MKAVEISAKTDKQGLLKIDYPLKKKDKRVRVLILFDEKKDATEDDEEKLWMKSISSNPAFEFLKEKEEDIYSLTDGEPFND